MKRMGKMMEAICSLQNLESAFFKAVRGKRTRPDVIVFCKNLLFELMSIGSDLYSGKYVLGNPKVFTVYDPKKRLIVAAPFRDRVAFHAVMNVCHSRFESFQVYDSYASRIAKGTYAALDRAKSFADKYPFFAKLDVIHYFDSIDHEVLKSQLLKLFKDSRVLEFFGNVIDSYGGKVGLPIGNLTSQYFANHYLAIADHYMKEVVKVGPMIRYMDDVLLFGNTTEELSSACKSYSDFLSDVLKLSLHPVVMNRTCYGIPFLGYVVYPHRLRLSRRSVVRFKKKTFALHKRFVSNLVCEEEYVERMQSLFAFVLKADTLSIRRNVIENMEILSS